MYVLEWRRLHHRHQEVQWSAQTDGSPLGVARACPTLLLYLNILSVREITHSMQASHLTCRDGLCGPLNIFKAALNDAHRTPEEPAWRSSSWITKKPAARQVVYGAWYFTKTFKNGIAENLERSFTIVSPPIPILYCRPSRPIKSPSGESQPQHLNRSGSICASFISQCSTFVISGPFTWYVALKPSPSSPPLGKASHSINETPDRSSFRSFSMSPQMAWGGIFSAHLACWLKRRISTTKIALID